MAIKETEETKETEQFLNSKMYQFARSKFRPPFISLPSEIVLKYTNGRRYKIDLGQLCWLN